MAIRKGNAKSTHKILYNPYQLAFHSARRARTPSGKRAFNRLTAIAGRRSGKTAVCGAISVVEEAANPNWNIWCCAPSFPELHDYVIPAVMRVLPQHWVIPGKDGWSEEHKQLNLVNGTTLKFRSLDDPERGRGDGVHVVWLDETCKIQKKAWDYLEPALTEYDGIAILTSSPRGYDWVHDDFYKPAMNGEPGYFAVRYKTSDNPIIKKEVIERRRQTTDPKLFAQEYEAEFVIFEGAIFADYLPRVVIQDYESIGMEKVKRLLPDWPRINGFKAIVGLDPGADHPFAATLEVVTPRGIIQVAEYKERLKTAADHAGAIKAMVGQYQFDSVLYAIDRSQKQMQIELAQYGIYAVQAENAVKEGIHRVQSWMSAGQSFVIASKCPKTVEELSSYQWADTVSQAGESGKERPKKVKDDLMDAKRYAYMTWPHLPNALDADALLVREETVPVHLRAAWSREQKCSGGIDEDAKLLKDNPMGDFAYPQISGGMLGDTEAFFDGEGYEQEGNYVW